MEFSRAYDFRVDIVVKGVGELVVVVVVSDVVSNVGTGAHVGCSANSSCC